MENGLTEEQKLWYDNFAEFGRWASSNNPFMLVSYPRSGREWLCNIFSFLTGKESLSPGLVVPGTYSDYLFFLGHLGQKKARDIVMGVADRVKILLLVRDPRDAALSGSYRRVYFWQYAPTEYSSDVLDGAIRDVCSNWASLIEDFMRLDAILVQYEHFCIEPVVQIERIINFFGLDIDGNVEKAVIEFDETNRIRKVVSPKAGKDIERVAEAATFVDGRDRYLQHCCKWQRDGNFRECHNRQIVLALGDSMGTLGYHSQGHDLTCWRWKLEKAAKERLAQEGVPGGV